MSAKKLFAILAVFLPLVVAAQSVAPPPQPLHLVNDHWTPYDPPAEFPEGARAQVVDDEGAQAGQDAAAVHSAQAVDAAAAQR